ncbi:DMT family transporter [Thermococcus sp.]
MTHHHGYIGALLAAFLFGISSTLNKIALENVHPLVVAGSIYLTAGVVLMVIRYTPVKDRILEQLKSKVATQDSFSRKDFLLLGVIALFGSFLAPLLFMFGLDRTTAVNASLLLNTETLFTVILALLLFGEKISRRGAIGILFILIGAVVVSTESLMGVHLTEGLLGNALVVLASLSWAIDNNLSKLLSLKRDLLLVTSLKGLLGGSALLSLAVLFDISLDIPLESLPYLLTVGSLSIGFSIVLFLFALREIGAMKTGAIFATSSLMGAVTAFLVLGESFTGIKAIFGMIMLGGVYLLSE